jgi:hypothetical protein
MEPNIYPSSRMALLDARVVAVAWGSMALAAVLWFPGRLLNLPVFASLLLVVVGVFFAAAVLHVILSFQHACPVCGKHPTVEGLSATHVDSQSQAALRGWSGAVLNILRRRQLVCIHCGTRFAINA